MGESDNQSKWLVAAIAGGLFAWGVLLGIGAYFAPSDPAKAGDFRKLWVVAGMVGLFLLLWGSVLAVRARKVRQKGREDDS